MACLFSRRSFRMTFRKIGVCSEIIELLHDKGMLMPTEVQKACIPEILSGRSLIT